MCIKHKISDISLNNLCVPAVQSEQCCIDLSLSVGCVSCQPSLSSLSLLTICWTLSPLSLTWLLAGSSGSLGWMKLFFTSTSLPWGRLVEKSSAAILSSSSKSQSQRGHNLTAWWLLPVNSHMLTDSNPDYCRLKTSTSDCHVLIWF